MLCLSFYVITTDSDYGDDNNARYNNADHKAVGCLRASLSFPGIHKELIAKVLGDR